MEKNFCNLCSVSASKSVYRADGRPFETLREVRSINHCELERLVSDYEAPLYRAALAILGNPCEAEDAVQDAFLRYLEKAPAFEGPQHQRAWLLRVTVNLCKSRLRSPWRHRTVPLSDLLPDAPPEDSAVLDAVGRLPPKERAAVHLFYYEGYQAKEIAAMTGEAEGTVRARLSRARKKLRGLLDDDPI